jgi:hypothetical protein
MRVRVEDPRALKSLTAALLESGCIVTRTERNALEVGAPWQLLDVEAAFGQAELELRFFLRSWEGLHPGIGAKLVA